MAITTNMPPASSADQPTATAVAVYLRVSTDEQREQQTIESQRLAADRYLVVHDITPYGWYVDDGVSGTLPLADRPEGRRLLADVAAGSVTTVLFHKLDRMGRSVRVLIDARDALMAAGCQLISINEHLDTSNAAGRMFFNQLSTFAEFERDTIVERSTDGTTRSLHAGGWQGGRASYGYVVAGKDKDARLVPDGQPFLTLEAMSAMEAVRLMYALTVEEGWTCQRIADHLNTLGVPTHFARDGKRYKRGSREHPVLGIWRANRIREILANPVYKGVYTYGRRTRSGLPREVVTCAVDALVSAETWDAAQVMLHRHLLWSPRNAQHDYLLRGLITCAHCERTYIGTGYPSGHIYVCTGKRRAKALYGAALADTHRCPSRSIPADWIEGAIWGDIEQYLRHPDETLALVAARLRGQGDQADAIREHLVRIQQQQSAKQAEKDSVIALFRRGRITERDLDRQLDDIAREEADLRGQMERGQRDAKAAREVEERLLSAEALLQRLRGRLDDGPLTPTLKREIVEKLVLGILVRVTEIGVSRYGNPKKHVHVHVDYCFEEKALLSRQPEPQAGAETGEAADAGEGDEGASEGDQRTESGMSSCDNPKWCANSCRTVFDTCSRMRSGSPWQ